MNPYSVVIDVGGIWHYGTWILISIAVIYITIGSFQRIGWAATVLWLYTMLFALYILEAPITAFPYFNLAFQKTSGEAFAEVFLIPYMVLGFRKTTLRMIWKIIPYVLILNLFLVWIKGYGIMSAPSFDMAMTALIFPFVPIWFILIGLLTMAFTHGSTALMIVGCQVAVWAFYDRKVRTPAVLVAVMLVILSIVHSHGPLLDGSERLEHWSKYMQFWSSDWRAMIFGVGPGSFMWTSLMIDQFKSPMFLQMHSDFLQVMFEIGLIGWGLCIAVIARGFRRSKNKPRQIAGLLGLVAFSLTYHPLRYAPTIFITALIVRGCIDKDSETFIPESSFFIPTRLI